MTGSKPSDAPTQLYETWAAAVAPKIAEVHTTGSTKALTGTYNTAGRFRVQRQESGLLKLTFLAKRNGQNAWHAPLAVSKLNDLLAGSVLGYVESNHQLQLVYDPRPKVEAAADYPYLHWLVAAELAIAQYKERGGALKNVVLPLQLNGINSEVSLTLRSGGIDVRCSTTDDTRWRQGEAIGVFRRYAAKSVLPIGMQNGEFWVIFQH